MGIFSKIFTDDKDKDKQRFRELEVYFQDLTAEELLLQDVDDYVGYAAPELKGIMFLFVQDFLKPFLANQDKDRNMENLEYNLPEKRNEFYKNGSLMGSSRINPWNMTHLGKLTVKSLIEIECPLTEVSHIDLSENCLGSADLQFVRDLVVKLDLENKLSKAVVSLKNNRIHGIQDMETNVRIWVNELVSIPNVAFLDLSGNPFCSIDQMAFFQKIGSINKEVSMPNSQVVEKLIWVDRWNIFSSGWQALLQSQDVVHLVRVAHLKYFEPENLYIQCKGKTVSISKNSRIGGLNPSLKCSECDQPFDTTSQSLHHIYESRGYRYLSTLNGELCFFGIRDWETGLVKGFSSYK